MSARILLIDDDASFREVFANVLKIKGFQVTPAINGKEALAFFTEKGPYDLVVSDILMPGMDGFKFMAALREHPKGAQIPVILVSGVYPSGRHERQAMADYSIKAYLDKPFSPEAFVEQVEKALGGRHAQVREERANSGVGASFLMNPKHIPLNGTLDQAPLALVLSKLYRVKASGELFLQQGDLRKDILFIRGSIKAVSSNITDEFLAESLTRTGKIGEDEKNAILELAKLKNRRIGDVLIERGWIEPHELPAILREQGERRLLNTFEWEAGTYRFKALDTAPLVNAAIEKPTPALIKEGITRFLPYRVIKESFLDSYRSHYIGKAPDAESQLDQVFYNRRQYEFLSSLDGRLTVAEAMGRSPFKEWDTARLLYGFVVLAFCHLKLPGSESGRVSGRVRLNTIREEEAARAPQFTDHGLKSGESDPGLPTETLLTPGQKDFYTQIAAFYDEIKDKNYFDLFSISRDAPLEEVRKQYFKYARMFHPDSLQHKEVPAVRALGEKVFSLVTRAYAALSNADQRAAYTMLLEGKSNDATDIAMNIFASEAKFSEAQKLIRARRWDQAVKVLKESLELNPDEAEYQGYLAWAEFNLAGGEKSPTALRTATQDMKAVVEKAPKSDQLNYYLGLLYKFSGQLNDARACFQTAVNLNPHLAPAASELRLLTMQKESEAKKSPAGLFAGLINRVKEQQQAAKDARKPAKK